MAATILLFFSVFSGASDLALPVYLKPNNPAATGHFSRQLLQSRLVNYEQHEWVWVSDALGQQGWTLKANLILPLDFSRQAQLKKGEALYGEPDPYQSPTATLPNSQLVSLVDRRGTWYKVLYKMSPERNGTAWVRESSLSAHAADAGLFFATEETHLLEKPEQGSRKIATVASAYPLIPLHVKNQWALVQFSNVKGYLPLKLVKTRMDVALKVRTDKGYFKPSAGVYDHKVLEIFTNPVWAGTGPFQIELKKSADMSSETLAMIPSWTDLTIQGYTLKRWGQSQVPLLGKVWWPESTLESNVELKPSQAPLLVKLKKDEIYQIEKSPLSEHLYFASSTQGIFRSFDLKKWQKIGPFDSGFPLKVSNNGVLFVADKVSYDHGETFRDYIRWDRLLESIPNRDELMKGPVKIVNVETHSGDHRRLTLSLQVDKEKFVQVYTSNLGKDWRLQ